MTAITEKSTGAAAAPAKTESRAEHLKQWLLDRNKLISILAVEEAAGVPRSTLSSYLKGFRHLPPAHLPAIVDVVKRLGYQYPGK